MKKNVKTTTITMFAAVLFLMICTDSLAHFGSKGPFGGTVNCMIVHDTIVYVGTENGGVFESVNSQITSWRARPVGLKSGKISSLTHTGSYLFAATADSGIYRFTGYVGSDRYWEKMNTGLTQLKVKSLLALDSITVLAGTEGNGLFKSTDKGENWAPVNSILINGSIVSSMAKSSGRIFLATQTGGVFSSDDNGDTWSDFNDMNTGGIAGTNLLSYNSVSDELIVLNQMGLFITGSASGMTMPSYSSADAGLPGSLIIRNISSDSLNWYMATNSGIYSSPSGVLSWSAQNAGLSMINTGAVVPYQNMLISGSKGDGMSKSPKGAISWTAVNTNFNNLRTYAMITKDAALVIAGTEKGVFVSTDLASTYSRANNGLTDSLHVTNLAFFGSTLIVSTMMDGIFISPDTGKNWTAFNTNLFNLYIKKVYTSSSFVYLIDVGGDIYQSDLNAPWSLIQSGLPLAADPTSMAFFGNNILLGTMGDGVFMRPEASGTWTQINNGLTNLNVTSVTANHTNLFAGTNGDGVFTADLMTMTWVNTSPTSIAHTTMIGLNGNIIQDMAVNGGYIFASYQGGLLATSDNGATWIEGGNQFNLPSYTHVKKISFVTTRVFVTSEYNSLYSNALSELPSLVGISELSTGESDAIILSPNPTRGLIRISTRNDQERIKELSVFDLQGRLIEEHVQISPSNNTEINLHLSTGIYLLRVYTDERILFQKFIAE